MWTITTDCSKSGNDKQWLSGDNGGFRFSLRLCVFASLRECSLRRQTSHDPFMRFDDLFRVIGVHGE